MFQEVAREKKKKSKKQWCQYHIAQLISARTTNIAKPNYVAYSLARYAINIPNF